MTIAVASWLLVASLAVQAAPPDRVARVERWLSLVEHHTVGTLDDDAKEVAAWSDEQLSMLFTDLRSIAQLMRNINLVVKYRPRGGRIEVPLYEAPQLDRMRILACAAGGIVLTDQKCISRRAVERLTPNLRELAARAEAGRGVVADNFILKYGALLHTDIALFAPAPLSPITYNPAVGVQRLRVLSSDGQPTEVGQSAAHWEIARMLLDFVRLSRDEGRPSPDRDAFVRDWYVATNAWLQFNVHYDNPHLDRARELFPNDRDILFLNGTQHEIYATRRIQSVVKTVTLPRGFTMDMKTDAEELRMARDFFRRALATDAGFAEARVHLGHVLALERSDADAERELSAGFETIDDQPNQYFAALFLGSVKASLSRFDQARELFAQAAASYPLAQSPMLSLSELARRRGDRKTALEHLRVLFTLPPAGDSRKDPWWAYDIWHARDCNDLLNELWRPFRSRTAH